ncbi:hypothetical protein Shyhy01_24680 [Streptomyces hygroscopicus subsp. hygroscopicus]|nr:hypothetical protein [Streptomyces hygroscopicus]GLX49518.1 hypothetical protein Shyhy01_24680 [Streptomyces hygroscopicus subsp. hygroscopicus]
MRLDVRDSSAVGGHLGQDTTSAGFVVRDLTPAEPSPDPEPGGLMDSACADPAGQLTGIPLTQVGTCVPAPVRLMHDFWATLHQAIDD